jgi:glucan phosphoethanolaminetransferase (alkaline phosphatase superfamily)
MSPKIRQYLYVFGVVAFASLTVLSTLKIIDPNTAASVSAALTSVLGLLGISVASTAAYNINKQKKNGAFDSIDPAEQVINGINAVIDQQQQAQNAADRVKNALNDAVKDIPVLGPLAQQAMKNYL